MREILFRGKQCENNKWIIGYLSSKHTITITTPCGNTDEIVICADTVGQYTGLNDKNGKKIFEGDIVKADNGHISEVTFHFGAFCCYCQCHDTHNTLWGDILTVIGNVHDNPELLEK